jgi:ferrous iron transport protein B
LLKDKTPLHKNKIAIIGNPNVGKSAIYNHITKSYSFVSNAPYTTISVKRSDITIENRRYEIIDTPGILSLDVQSEDGLVARNILIEDTPDIIILCIDTNNIKRSFNLMAQIIELDIPMVVCLNFLDESRLKGIVIAREKLEELLGVPVVETVASEGIGVKELTKAISRAAVPEKFRINYNGFIKEALDKISDCFPSHLAPSDGVLILLLMKDHHLERFIETEYGRDIFKKANDIVERMHIHSQKDISRSVFEARNRWTESISKQVVETHAESSRKYGDLIGGLCRHPFWGWIILAGVIYFTYLMVGKIGIDILVPFFEKKIFFPILEKIGESIPWDFLKELLVGNYGVLTTGFANAVGTALPILLMFFLILNILEDTGYIPNLCVLTNRLFKMVGLSGKAVLPVILGFGCKTMATLTTRIIESKKERFIVIFLIAFAIPCAPLLGINLAILALFPFKIFLIVFGALMFVEVIAGVILNKFIRTDIYPHFIMEIPPIRLPNSKNLITKTYYRLKWFAMEAIPLFMIGSLILFFMEKVYVLDIIKHAVLPVIISFLNLPLSFVDALLLCLLRKEAGAVMFLNLAQHHQIDAIQAVVGIIMINCFVPCFANIMAMIKQLGLKAALGMTLVITFFSAIMGGIINYILRSF